MKIKILVIFSFVLLSVSMLLYDMLQEPSLTPYQNIDTPKTFMPLPTIQAPFLLNEQKKLNINDIPEDIILLNFWASWCTICMAEMDEMFDLIAEMNGQVALVTVSINDNKAQALKAYHFLKKRYPKKINKAHIYWTWDKNKIISLKTFNVSKTPETIIINKERLMVDKIIGVYDWASEEIREKLKNIN